MTFRPASAVARLRLLGPSLALAVLACALACGVFACGGGGAPPARSAPAPDPGVLHAPSEYPADFLDRQSIAAAYGDRSARFDAVLQKRGNELVLLGMTPFGSRAFVLKQTGLDVSFQSFVPQQLPFPPSYILMDVNRVFFAVVAPAGQALSDGPHEATREGEVVTEYWQAGKLIQRRFRRADGQPTGEVVVEYPGGFPPAGPPPERIVLTSGWYGYRLEITTVSHQAL